jgi:hypothetical protein
LRIGFGMFMYATGCWVDGKSIDKVKPCLAGIGEEAAGQGDGLDGLHADLAASNLSG